MKIFISWHGDRSQVVAGALTKFLHSMIHAVKPFYSPEIERGSKWAEKIESALQHTSFGIICLTPDNLESNWIHYEAGALSKTQGALIWTYLFGLRAKDILPPLDKFQSTLAEKADTLQLLKAINNHLADVGEEPLAADELKEQFDTFWPKLEKSLKDAESVPLRPLSNKDGREVETPGTENAVLNEILELVRKQERTLSGLEPSSPSRELLPSKKNSSDELRVPLPPQWPQRGIRDFAIELAVLIGALEWMLDRSERTNKTALRLLLNSTFTAREIDNHIKKAAARVGYHEPLEWDLIRPSSGQRFALKART